MVSLLNQPSLAMVHPTAIVDPSAKLALDVTVGPWTLIGPDVEIGAGTRIASHVVIQGPTKIGQNCQFFQFCSIGDAPQHAGYKGEPTRLEIGDHNIIREFVSINRGTVGGGGITRIGSHNFLMAYSHVAHDCSVGNHNIFANNASLAGHVTVDDHIILGAFSGVHQFCHIGAYSFLGRAAKVVQDVLPYMMMRDNPAVPCGLNSVGLRRHGFDVETIRQLRRAYQVLFRSGLTLVEATAQLEQWLPTCPALGLLLQGIARAKRGIARE